MGPYPFALAAALVAGLLAGLTLGTVRLTRLSLGWWRALRARWRRRGEAAEAGDDPVPREEPQGPPGPFPRAHGAVACATVVAVLLLVAALARETVPLAAAPPWTLPGGRLLGPRFAQAAGSPPGLAVFGLLALLAMLATALVAAALDRGVHRLARPLLARLPGPAAPDLELSLADLRTSALGLWGAGPPRWEPFGVGLGYVSLFASPAAALALLVTAPAGRPDRAALLAFAAAFLVVPLAYAAAAERSQRDEAARLRRRAAMRQLLAAPLWLVALLALTGAPGPATLAAAFTVLALALPFALPGSSPARSLLSVHRGGDLPEPSPSVRTLTGLAHHAWIGAWAALLGLVAVPAGSSVLVRVAAGVAVLLGLVVVRAGLALLLAGARPVEATP